jgi:hypothetical protein
MPALTHSSVVGSSTAARVLQCPASIDMSRQAPRPPESTYAAEGTALHMAVEHILLHDLQPADVVGLKFNGYEMTAELVAECVEPCLRAFEIDVADHPFLVEQRLPFPGIEGAFGTGDVIVLYEDGTLAGGMDWKFGAGVPVSAENNPQAMFLLCGQRAKYGRNEYGYYTFSFIQPRNGGYKTASYTDHDLDLFETALHHAVYARRDEIQQGKECRFCPAKLICPAQREMLRDMEKRTLLAAELGELLDRADRLKELVAAAEEMATELLSKGTPVPGLKLIAGKMGARRWKDEDGAIATLTDAGVDAMTAPQIVTPAEAERRAKKAGMDIDLTDITIQSQCAPRLVREAHPAPALVTKAEGLAALAAYANARPRA